MAAVPKYVLLLLSSDFLISVSCFALALNNLSIILLTEFTFLLGFSQRFASSSSQRGEGNKGGECKWGKQELKSRRTEELVLHSYYPLYFHSTTLHEIIVWIFCFPFVHSICALFQNFHQDSFHLRDGQCGSAEHHHQSQIWQHSKKCCDAILFYLSSSLHLCLPNRMTKKSTTILMGKAIQIDGKH